MARRLTTEEVAERYRTSPSTVRWWRHTGYLRAGTRYGRRVLYREDELELWDAERAEQEAAERGPEVA